MSHYYDEKSNVKSEEQRILIRFKNEEYKFITDNGVFCKDYLDFGTRIMLENSEIYGNKILDLGCGYGPVGVILLKNHSDIEVTMVDVNERALALSEKNLALNDVKGQVLKSNGLSDVSGLFTTILTNPPIRAGKQTVFTFYSQSYDHLEENGCLFVIIQKKQGAESSIKRLNELFGNCEVVIKEKGYFLLKSTKKRLDNFDF